MSKQMQKLSRNYKESETMSKWKSKWIESTWWGRCYIAPEMLEAELGRKLSHLDGRVYMMYQQSLNVSGSESLFWCPNDILLSI